MSRWFRLYDDTINDPKILKLSDKLFRVWIGLLCLASKNGGEIPAPDDVALMLRMKPSAAIDCIEKLSAAGLLDASDQALTPHNWSGRQFKSDVSNERVKRYRDRHRNDDVTLQAPLPKRPQSTDTETEQKEDAAADAAHVVPLVDPQKIYFDQAHETLGNGGRSLAAALLKAKGGNVAMAHSALLTASQKSNPREYLGAIIRGRGSTPEDLRARGEAW